ncbi:hypothetical protein EYF80_046325 [Liparis tanakae]|uniref:Uncharacterized protein n=1 Tax=Liparis tanakae TaxID=230148 RepID=A0A4Z2FRT8_9TELE|nr:hypothetical protein EYF80_046325 [Liparis tanakae]
MATVFPLGNNILMLSGTDGESVVAGNRMMAVVQQKKDASCRKTPQKKKKKKKKKTSRWFPIMQRGSSLTAARAGSRRTRVESTVFREFVNM